jgi:hypothetical protein
MQEHGDIELRAAARGMGYDVSAASRSDLAEMIAAGVVEEGGVDVRGWGRGGGKGSERKGNGRGTGRSSARSRVGRAVRGRGHTTGLRGPQNTPTGSRGQRIRARELAAAKTDIDLRGMVLDSAADLAVLGGDDWCKLSHTDLSSPAQPWAIAPQVALAGTSPEAFS